MKLSEPQKQLIHNAFIMLGEGVCPSPGDWCKKYHDINCPDCVLSSLLFKFDFCEGESLTEDLARLMQERLREFFEGDSDISEETLIKEIEEVEEQ